MGREGQRRPKTEVRPSSHSFVPLSPYQPHRPWCDKRFNVVKNKFRDPAMTGEVSCESECVKYPILFKVNT